MNRPSKEVRIDTTNHDTSSFPPFCFSFSRSGQCSWCTQLMDSCLRGMARTMGSIAVFSLPLIFSPAPRVLSAPELLLLGGTYCQDRHISCIWCHLNSFQPSSSSLCASKQKLQKLHLWTTKTGLFFLHQCESAFWHKMPKGTSSPIFHTVEEKLTESWA